MKSTIKLFLSLVFYFTCCASVKANGVNIYYTGPSDIMITPLIEIFEVKYEIPRELIEAYQVAECPTSPYNSYRLEICISEQELEVINSNPYIIESLSVFKRERK